MAVGQASTLHEWLYGIVAEVCFDREYLYRAFVEHFGALLQLIYRGGGSAGVGEYRVAGIKSPLEARIEWRLERQVSFAGPNLLSLRCRVAETGTPAGGGAAAQTPWERFELSSGQRFSG